MRGIGRSISHRVDTACRKTRLVEFEYNCERSEQYFTRGPGGPDKARTYWVVPSTNPARKLMLPEKRAADLRAVGPVHVCICGCTMFKTIVAFEDYKPSYYYLEGECLSCDAIVILPCEVDRPE